MAAIASTAPRSGANGRSPAARRRPFAAIHLPALARFAAFELALWSALYGLYLVVRGVSIASRGEALANARNLVDLEEALGLFQEERLQDAFAQFRDVLSAYYLLGFAPLIVAVLSWLALRDRAVYRELRTLLLLSIGLAVVVHVALPVAPPRLVTGLGIADTAGLNHDGGSFAGIPFNPYAAMPSMHVGWSLLVGLLAFQAARSRVLRGFFLVHPAVMAIAVTATGNHYFLDSLAGAAVAVAALGLWRLRPVLQSRLAAVPRTACAEC